MIQPSGKVGFSVFCAAIAFGLALAFSVETIAQQLARQSPEDIDPEVLALIDQAEALPRVPPETMAQLRLGGGEAQKAMADYLNDGNPLPSEVAARAVALSRAIKRDRQLSDPAVLASLHETLRSVTAGSICSPRIIDLDALEGYVPPPESFSYDFGTQSSPLATGFARMTPSSSGIDGGDALQTNREGALLSDGIAGARRIIVHVPNGPYNLILMLAPAAAEDAPFGGLGDYPLGERMAINGLRFYTGRAPRETWIVKGDLRNEQPQTVQASQVTILGNGGAIFYPFRVYDGTFILEFNEGLTGADGPLAGFLLEPFNANGSLFLTGEAAQYERELRDCLRYQERAYNAFLIDPEGDGPGIIIDTPPPPCPSCSVSPT